MKGCYLRLRNTAKPQSTPCLNDVRPLTNALIYWSISTAGGGYCREALLPSEKDTALPQRWHPRTAIPVFQLPQISGPVVFNCFMLGTCGWRRLRLCSGSSKALDWPSIFNQTLCDLLFCFSISQLCTYCDIALYFIIAIHFSLSLACVLLVPLPSMFEICKAPWSALSTWSTDLLM